jgi:hypothetical protein
MDRIELMAIRFLEKYGLIWPNRLAQISGSSWYKANKTLLKISARNSLFKCRIGRTKVFMVRPPYEKSK